MKKIKYGLIIVMMWMFVLSTFTFAKTTKANFKLNVGDTVKVTKNVKWNNKSDIISINSKKGLIKAIKEGNVKITGKKKKTKYVYKFNIRLNSPVVVEENEQPITDGAATNTVSNSLNINKKDVGSDIFTSNEEYQIYNSLMQFKNKYPEGTPWTNERRYVWSGGIWGGGYGCAAFAFELSDGVFGTAPAKTHTDISNIHSGDIIRLDNMDKGHSAIVLKRTTKGLIIAEGNYNKSVHWGRLITTEEMTHISYITTRI